MSADAGAGDEGEWGCETHGAGAADQKSRCREEDADSEGVGLGQVAFCAEAPPC